MYSSNLPNLSEVLCDATGDLSDAATVIVGDVARDLFDHESSHGHRTYRAFDHFWTGVDVLDGAEVCSDDCLSRYVALDISNGGVGDAETRASLVPVEGDAIDGATWLFPGDADDGQGAFDVVAHEFSAGDQDGATTCHVCGRLMTADAETVDFFGAMLRGYVETAVWAGLDWSPVHDQGEDNPRPMSDNYSVDDIGADALEELAGDVAGFLVTNWSSVARFDPARVGHDFYLTRNRHGAGFWDGDYPETVGRELTDAAHVYGTSELDVADDGELYVTN